MFLPAWRLWRQVHADADVAVVAKGRVAALWRLVRDVGELVILDDGAAGSRKCVEALRRFRPFEAIAVPVIETFELPFDRNNPWAHGR